MIKLSAESEAERNIWIDSLETSMQDALDDRRKDDPATPTSPTNKSKKRRKHYDGNLTKLVHKVERCSLLSSENVNKPDLRGFFNLILVVAIATNFRLIVENFIKFIGRLSNRDCFLVLFARTGDKWGFYEDELQIASACKRKS